MNHHALLAMAFVAAVRLTDPASAAAAHMTPHHLLTKSPARLRRQAEGILASRSRVSALEASARIAAASIETYPYFEGSLYRLSTAPDEVSDIALQPGETLVSVAAGDTARWVIGETSSGSGPARRAHVLVKPSAAALSTNLLIATDRRVYHLALRSGSSGGVTSISWTYADDALLALRAPSPPSPEAPVAGPVSVDRLDFNYRIEGDNPSWRPVRAFDDGRQVFIEFPPSFAEGEAPPLFILGEDGKAELVNYRQRGRYYLIDRLFRAAELRIGGKRQVVVRIVHGLPPSRRRPS